MPCTARQHVLCKDPACVTCEPRRLRLGSFDWDAEKNERDLLTVSKGSTLRCHLICSACKHPFPAQAFSITKGTGCPFCPSAKGNRKLCNDLKCKTCKEASFASNKKKATQWHATKNKGVTPRRILKSSHDECWFTCEDCRHDFPKRLCDITFHGSWCPYCAPTNGMLCSDDACTFCFSKSLASHPCAEFWDTEKNKGETPRQV